MAVQSNVYPASNTRVYLSSKHIGSKSLVRVFTLDSEQGDWEILSQDFYELINNSIVLKEVYDGYQIEVRVADTEDELTNNQSEISIIASNIENINTVASIDEEVSIVANRNNDIIVVANRDSDIADVQDNIGDIQITANNISNVNTVSGSISNVNLTGSNISNVNTVGSNIDNVNTVGLNSDDVTTVANNVSNVNTVAGDTVQINEIYNNRIEIYQADTNAATATTQAGIATTKASEASVSATSASNSATSATASATTATTQASNASASATSASNSATSASSSASSASASATTATSQATIATTKASEAAASALSASNDLATFQGQYTSSATEPTGSNEGDLWFDESTDIMKVYNGSSWQSAGSSVNGTSSRDTYTATQGQTTFNSNYDVGFVDVYLNGIKLQDTVDFTATNGSSVVLASGVNSGDIVDIVAYGTFQIADVYTQAQADALLDDKVSTSGNETIAGVKTFSSFPVTPSSAPTTDYQVANKKYVDDNAVSYSDFLNSKVTNGYQKLPGGLILQWLKLSKSSRSVPLTISGITFPITFPNACLNASCIIDNNVTTSGCISAHVSSFSNSSISVYIDNSTTASLNMGLYIFAIGH